jgi:FAD/FMN-containing dehydrogenase/Fe-S oxidoreductase
VAQTETLTGTSAASGNERRARTDREQARSLAADLEREVEGEVRFDAGSRALYASDLSIYRQVPIGVVIPRTNRDVIATVAACRRHGVPILGRGAATSLAGQTCNVAVVIDFSKHMNRIEWIDPERRLAHVQPGVICDQLRKAARAHGLTFGPDPGTHKYCTLGGMIGNNSCGAHTQMAGKTVDNVAALDILTYDGEQFETGPTSDEARAAIIAGGGRRGEIYRALAALRREYADDIRRGFPNIPRRVSGYNLDDLLPEKNFNVARALVGSESTCALTLGATMQLIEDLPKRALLVAGYADAAAAGDQVPMINQLQPTALDAFHLHVLENLKQKGKDRGAGRLLPDGQIWLLIEFGAQSQEEANALAENARRRLKGAKGHIGLTVLDSAMDQEQVWYLRESAVGSSRVTNVEHGWPAWEDAAVHPDRLGDYLRDYTRLIDSYGYSVTLYGHFGDGCVHTRINFDLKSADGIKRFRDFTTAAADLVVEYGGSLSGEHGDGQARAEFLPKMYGPRVMQAFREFKSIWDPDWRMNPGKVVEPYRMDENLRLGAGYAPRKVKTHFSFAEEDGVFSLATERCFGVGKCRTLENQTMCPSFQATREEMHSTRGRARLLFEAMRGDTIKEGWKSDAVRESLDLCLQCKGCKNDCPTSVDVATYKAEFMSHYYEGRLRPREAYAMGLIFWWARAAMLAPGLVNLITTGPVTRGMVRLLAGFTQKRPAPKFASETFQHWYRRNARPEDSPAGARPVILWPDTFNNHFTPGSAAAAAEVLQDAGCRVIVPRQRLCCGRSLYDFGMLDLAKHQLRQTVEALRPAIRAGIPVVGLEPSCISVFRDEMPNLLPDDEDAKRLAAQSFLLPEFLAQIDDWEPPKLDRKILSHMHCHHKSIIGTDAQRDLLERIGAEVTHPASGCCGQAGSFGYKAHSYDVSMRIAENDLLPAVREASKDTILMADGFSCRQQIEHGSGREAMHLADVLQLALHERQGARKRARPPEVAKPSAVGLALVAAMAVGGMVLLARRVAANNHRHH